MIKISFCTYQIGKDWDLEKFAKVAKETGYDGIEPRTDFGQKHGLSAGFRGEPKTSAADVKKAVKIFKEAGVSFASIATGVQFVFADAQVRKRNVEEAKEYVKLADQLGAKVIRLFGGPVPAGMRRVEAVGYVAECLNEVGKFARNYNVSPLIEQHDNWTFTVDLCDIMEKITEDKVGVLWNSTIDPQSFERLKTRLKHFHIHQVNPAVLETMKLLKSINYDGYLSLEGSFEQTLKEQATALRNYLKQL